LTLGVPATQKAGPSQPFTLVSSNIQVSSHSKDDEVASEDLVSSSDVMDAAKHVVDTFEDSVLSRVNDPKAQRHCIRLAQTCHYLDRVFQTRERM